MKLSEEEAGGFLPGLESLLGRVCVLFIIAQYNGALGLDAVRRSLTGSLAGSSGSHLQPPLLLPAELFVLAPSASPVTPPVVQSPLRSPEQNGPLSAIFLITPLVQVERQPLKPQVHKPFVV